MDSGSQSETYADKIFMEINIHIHIDFFLKHYNLRYAIFLADIVKTVATHKLPFVIR